MPSLCRLLRPLWQEEDKQELEDEDVKQKEKEEEQ
jgi:hypothetical protein